MNYLWSPFNLEKALNIKIPFSFQVTRVVIDSREVKPGDLFIALKGPQNDGSHYVNQAFAQGAVAAIVSSEITGEKGCVLKVEDTFKALQDLGKAARSRTQGKMIGITGSFGKTSTKEALYLILKGFGSVTASERSFNNHWGVPLTLANLKSQDDYGVIEMGMNHKGEIKPLSELTRPHVALITNIRAMHLETLGSLEAIMQEKCQIFTGMSSGDWAILNADDQMFAQAYHQAEAHHLRILSFGKSPMADIRLLEWQQKNDHIEIQAKFKNKKNIKKFNLPVRGGHWGMNILGVLAVIEALQLDMDQSIQILQNFHVPEGRGTLHHIPYKGGELILIDESYNAGPDSMRAALLVLGGFDLGAQGRRIALLGDMRELGEDAILRHQELKELLIENNIDLVFTCGVWMKHLFEILPCPLKGGHAEGVKDLIPEVIASVRPGDVVMSKGSKGQYARYGRMYGFIEALLKLREEKSLSERI